MASKIEWTDETWQATHGCRVVSPGCTNCYAMRMAARLERMGQAAYAGLTTKTKVGAVWNGTVRAASDEALTKPLTWKKPRRIFVDSMADLFAEGVEDEWIDRACAVMAMCPQHTFQVLTKRPGRMREYFESRGEGDPWAEASDYIAGARQMADSPFIPEPRHFPLPNVWLGTSAEDQPRADERRPHLEALARMGWNTWVSYEPALGPVDWSGWEFIKWMVSGGESGPNARPSHPDWHRATCDWCAGDGVSYFFKQWGAWTSHLDRDTTDPDWRANYSQMERSPEYQFLNLAGGCGFHGDRLHVMKRVGKKLAGAVLDGREHKEFPR